MLEACPEAVCLRTSWMYDFDRPGLKSSTGFWGILRRAAAGKMPLSMALREYRGITWVQPVVKAMEQMAALPGGVYNMGAENPLNTYATALECLGLLGAGEDVLALVRPDTDRWPEFERNLSMDTSRLKAGCGVDLGDTVGSFAACLRAFEEQEEEAM